MIGIAADPDFMPHVSLLYGRHSQQLKERIARAIVSDLPLKFKVRKLYLYNTQGRVHRWHEVAQFPLGGSCQAGRCPKEQ